VVSPDVSQMTGLGSVEADWTSATFATGAGSYSFVSEGVVQNILSTNEAPSALLVKDGAGLLSDRAACTLLPDVVPTSADPTQPGYHTSWINPLAAAIKDGTVVSAVVPEVVSGVPRCVMKLVPLQGSASSMAIMAIVDKAIAKYGADWHSQVFVVEAKYKAQVQKLADDKVAAKAVLQAALADSAVAQAEHDDVKNVQLPQLQTDLTANQNTKAMCTSTTLVKAQEASATAKDQISSCKTQLNAIPGATAVAAATVSTVTQSLTLAPFTALPVDCIVAKTAYHSAYPDVLAAGQDAWQHYSTIGRAKGNTWTGGDSCGVSGTNTNAVRYYTTDSGRVCLDSSTSGDVLASFDAGKKLFIHDLVAAADTPSSTVNDRRMLTVTGQTADDTGAYTCIDFTPAVTFPRDQVAAFTDTLLSLKEVPPDLAPQKPPYDICKWTPGMQVTVGYQGKWWGLIKPFGGAQFIPAQWISLHWGNADVGKIVDYKFNYYFTDPSGPVTATMRAMLDNDGIIYVNKKQVVGVWDGNTDNVVTIQPGINNILITNSNQGGPMGAVMAVVYNGTYLFGTGPEWTWSPSN
jgi:hypothetical protein